MELSDLKSSLLDKSYSLPVIVIGMHRSGTSLIAGIMASLGVHIGDVLDIHNEAVCFKEINRALMLEEGGNWARPEPFIGKLANEAFVANKANQALQLLGKWGEDYGVVRDNQLWGWKDPRNTLTLPIWLSIFPNAKVIHAIRDGLDVALSLYRRALKHCVSRSQEKRLFPPTVLRGYRLWKQYLDIGLEHETRFRSTVSWKTVHYEQMISQPTKQIESLCSFLGLAIEQESIRRVAETIVGQPTQPSTLEMMQVRILLKLGLIDLKPLIALSYYSPHKPSGA